MSGGHEYVQKGGMLTMAAVLPREANSGASARGCGAGTVTGAGAAVRQRPGEVPKEEAPPSGSALPQTARETRGGGGGGGGLVEAGAQGGEITPLRVPLRARSLGF